MSENLKLFLQKAAENPELFEQLKTLEDKDVLIATAIEAAAAMGIELAPGDFEPADDMSEDELAAVAGGVDKQCSCILGGGGSEDDINGVCACVIVGASDTVICCLIGME